VSVAAQQIDLEVSSGEGCVVRPPLVALPGAPATSLDAVCASCSRSVLAADDPRRPLLDWIAELIAADFLRGGTEFEE
jgi:hypothetical protein